jgi:hypothetical protein
LFFSKDGDFFKGGFCTKSRDGRFITTRGEILFDKNGLITKINSEMQELAKLGDRLDIPNLLNFITTAEGLTQTPDAKNIITRVKK